MLLIFSYAYLPFVDLPRKYKNIEAPEYLSGTLPGRFVLLQSDTSHLATFTERIDICNELRRNELNRSTFESAFGFVSKEEKVIERYIHECDPVSIIINSSLPEFFQDLGEIDRQHFEKVRRMSDIRDSEAKSSGQDLGQKLNGLKRNPEYQLLLKELYDVHLKHAQYTKKSLNTRIYLWNIFGVAVLLLMILFREVLGVILLLPFVWIKMIWLKLISTAKQVHEKI